MPSEPTQHPPVYCAIVDSAYFLGAVALINSLRLTGHTGEISFLDVGLGERQRAFLEQEARIHRGTDVSGWVSVFAKPVLGLLEPDRVVVMLDNDLIITGSLEPLVDAASEGAIAAVRDPDPTRWFGEWEEMFSLRAPLRRGVYANGGCVALSTDRWHEFLVRWFELGQSVAEARAKRPFVMLRQDFVSDPVGLNEQDTLNALLMSEVPEGSISLWEHDLTPHWVERDEVRVVDSRTLRCDMKGQAPLFLHCTGQPKPWQPRGWLVRRFGAFNSLLTRVLTGEDVRLRLPPEQIPPWLRSGARARMIEHSSAALAETARGALTIVPTGLKTRFTSSLRARLSGTRGRA